MKTPALPQTAPPIARRLASLASACLTTFQGPRAGHGHGRALASLAAACLTMTLLATAALAQGPSDPAKAPPTAEALLAAMDRNLQCDTRSVRATMTVDDGRATRTYQMQSFSRGLDEAAVEYLSPARDKGTRMLKQQDNLWLFIPRAERVQKISGHLLRQGMMGSDLSYEDFMQATQFLDLYTAKVTGEATVNGRPCWKLEATAKNDTVSYPRRVILIDKAWLLPVQQELFALSGMLLKTWTMSDVRMIQDRPVAHRMEFKDQVRKGSTTVLALEDVLFGVKLEAEVFSRRWLERK